MIVATIFLIILKANGLVIPPIAWFLFGVSWVLSIAKAIVDNRDK